MLILGFYHEQSRYDRDSYVKINFENIKKDGKSNFYKRQYQDWQSITPYDYCSVMHYSEKAFAKVNHKMISDQIVQFPSFKKWGLTTIEPLKPLKLKCGKIGQRKRLSKLDWKKINLMYNCRK